MEKNRANLIVRFIVKHPILSLDEVSRSIGKEPTVGHSIGSERRTPAGDLLQGLYSYTLWSVIEEVKGSGDLFSSAVQMVEEFESKGADFKKLTLDGATMSLVIDIFDDSNIAGMLSLDHMKFLLPRGIHLGIELYHNQLRALKLNNLWRWHIKNR